VSIHDSGSRKQSTTFKAHDDAVNVLRWWGAQEVLTGSDDCTAKHWDLRATRRPLSHFTGHRGWVKNCEVVNERLCLTAAFDGTVRVWDRYEASTPHHPPDMLAAPPVALYSARLQPQPNIMFYHPELLRIAVHRGTSDDWGAAGRRFAATEQARGSTPPSSCCEGGGLKSGTKLAISVGRAVILVRDFDPLTAGPELLEASALLPAASLQALDLPPGDGQGEGAVFGETVDQFMDEHLKLKQLCTAADGGEVASAEGVCGGGATIEEDPAEAGHSLEANDSNALSRPQQLVLDAVRRFLLDCAASVQGGGSAVEQALPLLQAPRRNGTAVQEAPHRILTALAEVGVATPVAGEAGGAGAREGTAVRLHLLLEETCRLLQTSHGAWSQRLQETLGVQTMQGLLFHMGLGGEAAAEKAEARLGGYLEGRGGTGDNLPGAKGNIVQRMWGSQDEHVFALRFDASGCWLAVRSSYSFLATLGPADDTCAHFQHSAAMCSLPQSWSRATVPPLDLVQEVLQGSVRYAPFVGSEHMPCVSDHSGGEEPRMGGCTNVLAVDGPVAEAMHSRSYAEMAAVHGSEGGMPACLAAWAEVGWEPTSTSSRLSHLQPEFVLSECNLPAGGRLLTPAGQLLAVAARGVQLCAAPETAGCSAAVDIALAAELLVSAVFIAAHPANPAVTSAVQKVLGTTGPCRFGGARPWLAPSLQGGGLLHCTVLRMAHPPHMNNGIITAPCFSAGVPPSLLVPWRGSMGYASLHPIHAQVQGGGAVPLLFTAALMQEAQRSIHYSVLYTLQQRQLGAPDPPAAQALAPQEYGTWVLEGGAAARHSRTQGVADALLRASSQQEVAFDGVAPVLTAADVLFVMQCSAALRAQLPETEQEQAMLAERLCVLVNRGHHGLTRALLQGVEFDSVLDISVPPPPPSLGGLVAAAISSAHAVAVTQHGRLAALL